MAKSLEALADQVNEAKRQMDAAEYNISMVRDPENWLHPNLDYYQQAYEDARDFHAQACQDLEKARRVAGLAPVLEESDLMQFLKGPQFNGLSMTAIAIGVRQTYSHVDTFEHKGVWTAQITIGGTRYQGKGASENEALCDATYVHWKADQER